MKKKIIIISLFFIFISSCGFSPIYSNKNNKNFSIEKISFTGEGDRILNNFLKINLKKYKNQNSSKKYLIDVITEYKKDILTKDSTGKITNYELNTKVIFLLKSTNKKLIFSEKKIMETQDDKFEENKYETSIKQSFAISISNKLISALITLQ